MVLHEQRAADGQLRLCERGTYAVRVRHDGASDPCVDEPEPVGAVQLRCKQQRHEGAVPDVRSADTTSLSRDTVVLIKYYFSENLIVCFTTKKFT